MKPELHILHLEDNRTDAVLIRSLLAEEGIVCDLERVQSRDDFVTALEQGEFDLIFSDFTMPGFNGLAALELARRMRPEIPFLFVSGTLGEDVAVDTLQQGATDYVLKQRLERLGPAVHRALAGVEERAARRRAEQSLAQSEFKYRHLFECLGEAALLVDASTERVLDANQRAARLLGRTPMEIIGLNRDQLHPPATLTTWRQRVSGLNDAARPVSFEGELLAKDGRVIPVSVCATAFLLGGRHLVLELCEEIGERRHAEEEIRRLREELEQRLRLRTGELDAARRELEAYAQFLGQDLRGRLREVGDSAQQVMAQCVPRFDPATDLTLAVIRNGVEQVDQLIDGLLAFSKLRTRPLHRSSLDMTGLARTVFEELERHFPGRELRFELNRLPPAVADPDEIRQVFVQLLSNAIKFTRGRRPAEIRAGSYAEARQQGYFISDNGIGFEPEEGNRLFAPFQRLHAPETFGGVGLGLATVQRIIQRHGGEVGAEGRVNAGAIFYFTLPKSVEPA